MQTHDGELNIGLVVRVAHSVPELIDILDPLLVTLQSVSGEADNLDTSFLELLLLARDLAKFSCADLIKTCTELSMCVKAHDVRSEKLMILTGVKSAGCEKRMPQESPSQSWNLMGPLVVSASKSGAMLPRRRDIVFQQR